MIKLKEILEIDDMKYSDEVKPKHQKKMSMKTELIGDVTIPNNPFPENSSRETRNELQWLLNYNGGVIDRNMTSKGDDVDDLFEDYCEENNLEFDEDYYEKILEESSKTI